MYFKQYHIAEILYDVSVIETFLTEIPSTVEGTYNTAYSNDPRLYFFVYFLFILKIMSHFIINTVV